MPVLLGSSREVAEWPLGRKKVFFIILNGRPSEGRWGNYRTLEYWGWSRDISATLEKLSVGGHPCCSSKAQMTNKKAR